MTSIAAGLFKALPKPKYTGEDEDFPVHAQPRGPRVVGAGSIDESQIVLKVSPLQLASAYLGMLIDGYACCSELAPQHMASVQDGAREPQRTLAMVAPFQRSPLLNIRLTWAEKARHRSLMPWLSKLTRKGKSNTMR
jgi:hypothetical protein